MSQRIRNNRAKCIAWVITAMMPFASPVPSVPVRALLFLIAIFLPGCGRRPLNVQFNEKVEYPSKSVVILFADGLDVRRMDVLLGEKKLPNIQKLFVAGGVRVQNAINCLPAMTYPNSVALFTGQFPGHHGIMGNQWFDRRNMFWIDYIAADKFLDVNRNFKSPTLYERLPNHYTVNVQGHTHRGATRNIGNTLEPGFAWAVGWYLATDEFIGGSMEEVAMAANAAGRWPSVLTFYFPGIDQVGHEHGSDSAIYREMVVNLDVQIGRVTDALQKAGMMNRTMFVLVSDHGILPTSGFKSFDFKNWLERYRGLKCHEGDIPRTGESDRRAFLDAFECLYVDGSHRRIMLHLKGPGGWNSAPTTAEVARLVEGDLKNEPMHKLPCVEYVCTREDGNSVRIRSRSGAVIAERRLAGAIKEYRIVVADGPPACDALGLAESDKGWNCIAAGWLTSREWLQRTAGSRHPDFVPQIVEYFDSPCAGDVLVFAEDDWVFSGAGKGEHGSCLASDMRIPLFFAGPDLPKGAAIETGRLVDVMPTILDLLGESAAIRQAPAIDGQSLAHELRTNLSMQ